MSSVSPSKKFPKLKVVLGIPKLDINERNKGGLGDCSLICAQFIGKIFHALLYIRKITFALQWHYFRVAVF